MAQLTAQNEPHVRFRTTLVDSWARLRADGRMGILAVVAAGWFLSIGIRMVYPVILPDLRAAYGLDLATAGLLLSVLFLFYGLGQFPGGLLSDRFGERRVLVGSTLVSALTLGLVVTARSAAVLFVATALFGLGLALYAVARYTLFATVFPDRLGTANGVASAAADAGQSVLPPVGGALAAAFAWQYGLGISIPLFVVTALGLWLVVPRRPTDGAAGTSTERVADGPTAGASSGPGSTDEVVTDGRASSRTHGSRTELRDRGRGEQGVQRHRRSLREHLARQVRSLREGGARLWGVLRRRSVVRGTVVLVLGVSVWQAFTGFYPTYLIEVKGLSSTVVGPVFGFFFALGIVVQPLSGQAYDRFGVRRSLSVLMALSGAAILALPFAAGLSTLLVLTAVSGAMLGFAPVVQTYLLHSLPEDTQGSSFGLLRSISFTLGAASPLALGVAADADLFDEGFAVLGLAALLIAALAQRLPDR